MTVKLLTEHNLRFLSFEEWCTGSFESTFVKMPHYWQPRVTAHLSESMLGALAILLGLQYNGTSNVQAMFYCSLFSVSPTVCRLAINRLDSSLGRASAFGAGGRGFEFCGRTIPKV